MGILLDKESGLPERRESKIPVIDPTIPFSDSIYDELASALFMASHTSVALNEEIDIGLAELWIVVRQGYCLVAFFTL
jgi:hypothetical protein